MSHSPPRSESSSSLEPTLSVPNQKKQVEMVGPFILGRTLGKGTTGKVKAARHKDTGMEVAIKIIKKQYVKTHKNKIAREIAVMRLIDHVHVMKLYDVLETSQHIFLVLERVKGGELFDYILQKGRLPRKEALRLFAQIVQGVEFCHMHCLVHRDLKPENLLLDENLNIKIADFGMAQISPGGNKLLTTFCGSPHYGAPEVVSGIPYDGRKSDVWSLGVVFYALITGMLPFDNPNISNLLKMVKRGVYHIPKFVPEDCQDLIRRMLTVDVDKRITTPQIKYHRAFYGEHGTNLYFPAQPPVSPALEAMKENPIRSEADVDGEILKDLEGLGWGTADELREKLLTKTDADIRNLESMFYYMIQARNKDRIRENRSAPVLDPNEPDSPYPFSSHPASPVSAASAPHSPGPTSPRTPSSRAVSAVAQTRSNSSGSGSKLETGSNGAAPSADTVSAADSSAEKGGEDKKGLQARKRPMAIKIDSQASNAAAAAAGTKEYSTTPRFHRLKVVGDGSQEDLPSPAGPITPTPKKSWFRNLFRRRPSVEIVGKDHQAKGASGMYSEKTPVQILEEVHRVLTLMGVAMKASSASDYELKCEAQCYLDEHYQIVVHSKSGQLKYKGQFEPEEEDKKADGSLEVQPTLQSPPPNDPSAPNSPRSAKSPRDVHKAQQIKFTVEISSEQNDKVSCLTINHRTGDLLVYRGLYTDIIKHLQL